MLKSATRACADDVFLHQKHTAQHCPLEGGQKLTARAVSFHPQAPTIEVTKQKASSRNKELKNIQTRPHSAIAFGVGKHALDGRDGTKIL